MGIARGGIGFREERKLGLNIDTRLRILNRQRRPTLEALQVVANNPPPAA